MRKAMFGAGMGAMLLAGVALVVSAQGPPPPGRFGGRRAGPGGPMAGVFEFGGLMGGVRRQAGDRQTDSGDDYDHAHGDSARQHDYQYIDRHVSRAARMAARTAT